MEIRDTLQMVWGFMKWLYQKEIQDFAVSEILPRVMLWKKIMSVLQLRRRRQLFAHKVVENTRTVTWDLTKREQSPCAAREMFKERVQGNVSSTWGAPIWQHRGSEGLPEPMRSTLQRNKTESLSFKSLGMKTSEKGHSNNFIFSLESTATEKWRASRGVLWAGYSSAHTHPFLSGLSVCKSLWCCTDFCLFFSYIFSVFFTRSSVAYYCIHS